MSYDVSLLDPVTRERLHAPGEVKHLIAGGTYCLGGTVEMWLNITFNYAPMFQKAFQNDDGIHVLTGKLGAEAIPLLGDAISRLGNDVVPDYWEATEGNAKKALYGLLALCQMRPDGVIDISY